MADLPGNTQYGAGTPQTKFPKLNINPGGASRSSFSTPPQQASKISTPLNTSLGAPSPTKMSPLPTDYGTFKPAAEFPYEQQGGLINPQMPTLRQMPGENAGQYIIDKQSPGAMVKSNREFVTPSVKAQVLGGLPSQLFQVDHIIPLWAGGADTPNNLQVLAIAEHEKKTKAQSIPLTLLSAGLIDYDEARVLANTWQTRDLTRIPDLPAEGGNGLLDVKTAKEVYDLWKKQETGYQTMGQQWSSFKEALPETVQNFGEGWLPNWIREPVKGFVSGATGGIVPYVADEGENVFDKALGVGGVIAGSVWGIGKFSKLLSPLLARTGLKAFQPTKVGLASLASQLNRAQVVKTAAPSLIMAAKTGGVLGVGKAAVEGTKANLGNYLNYLKQNAAGNILRNTAVFVPYGLGTEAGRAILSSEDEDTMKSMAERLVLDVGLGGITGIASPTLKGAAGVAFGTYVLDSALGTPWRDAMMNAAVMGGLHGVGTLRPARINPEQLQGAIEKEATGAMQNVLHWWVPKVPEVAPGKTSEYAGLSTADDATRATRIKTAEEWTDEALQKLNGLNDTISSDEFEMYRRQIITAGHYLRQSALPPAEREAAMLQDLASVFKQAKDKTFDISVPETVPNFLKAAGEDSLFAPIAREMNVADTPTTGEIRLAGGGLEGVNEQNMLRFNQAVQEGRASSNLLIVNRPDTKPLWDLTSQQYTPEAIKDGLRKPFQNPQNAAQVYGMAKAPDGGVELVSLGWIPRRFTIDEKKFNFNTQPEIVEGKFPRNNPERNKDSIATRMTQEDIPVITMRLEKLQVPAAVKNKTRKENQAGSYLIGRISETDWQNSKSKWDEFRIAEKAPTEAPSVIPPTEGMPIAPGAPIQTQQIQEGVEGAAALARENMKAQDVLSNPLLAETSKPGQKQVADYLSVVDEAAATAGADDLVKLGIDAGMAQRITSGERVTAEELVGALRQENLIGEDILRSIERLLGPNRAQWFKPGTPGEKWGKLPVTAERTVAPKEEIAPVETAEMPAITEVAPRAPEVAPTPRASEAPVQDALPIPPPTQGPQLADRIVSRVSKGDIPVRPSPQIAKPAAVATPVTKVEPSTRPATEAPINEASYQEVKQQLEMLGFDRGAGLDPMGLDSYTDQLIRTIRNSDADEATQKALAEDAMRLLGRERHELVQEGIDSTRSNESWEKQVRDIGYDSVGKYIDAMRGRIANEFDIEPTTAASRRTAETSEETMDRVSTSIRRDAEPYFQTITKWKNLSPLTYQYGHNLTFDTLAKNIWGPSYTKNYNLMRFFSDKGRLGRDLYHGGLTDAKGNPVRNKRGQEVGGLMSTETVEGRQISQPKDYVEARGVGDKQGAQTALAERARALGAARKRIEMSQTEGAVARPIDERADVDEKALTNEFRIEDPTQAASENIQDLTKYEANNLFGLLSGIESGANPRLQPVRGVEDATTQIFNLIESWNLAVQNGYIKGTKVRLKDNKLLDKLREKVAKDTEQGLISERSNSQLRKELEELKKATESLREVTVSPTRRNIIDREIEGNEARIAEIQSQLGTSQPVVDGAGGPGFSQESPGIMFPQLQSLDTAISTPVMLKSNPLLASLAPKVAAAASSDTPITGVSSPVPSKVKTAGAATTLNTTQDRIKAAIKTAKGNAFVAAIKSATQVPGKAFEGLREGILTGVDKVTGNEPIVYQKGKTSVSEPSAVIMGYDTTRYATDPAHATKLRNIVGGLPGSMTNPQVVEGYIRTKFPNSPVTGSMIVDSAKRHGVPAQMLIAIMQNDSSMGTKGLGAKTRNPGNVGNDDDGNVRSYKTWNAGVDAVAMWLASNKAAHLAES